MSKERIFYFFASIVLLSFIVEFEWNNLVSNLVISFLLGIAVSLFIELLYYLNAEVPQEKIFADFLHYHSDSEGTLPLPLTRFLPFHWKKFYALIVSSDLNGLTFENENHDPEKPENKGPIKFSYIGYDNSHLKISRSLSPKTKKFSQKDLLEAFNNGNIGFQHTEIEYYIQNDHDELYQKNEIKEFNLKGKKILAVILNEEPESTDEEESPELIYLTFDDNNDHLTKIIENLSIFDDNGNISLSREKSPVKASRKKSFEEFLHLLLWYRFKSFRISALKSQSNFAYIINKIKHKLFSRSKRKNTKIVNEDLFEVLSTIKISWHKRIILYPLLFLMHRYERLYCATIKTLLIVISCNLAYSIKEKNVPFIWSNAILLTVLILYALCCKYYRLRHRKKDKREKISEAFSKYVREETDSFAIANSGNNFEHGCKVMDKTLYFRALAKTKYELEEKANQGGKNAEDYRPSRQNKYKFSIIKLPSETLTLEEVELDLKYITHNLWEKNLCKNKIVGNGNPDNLQSTNFCLHLIVQTKDDYLVFTKKMLKQDNESGKISLSMEEQLDENDFETDKEDNYYTAQSWIRRALYEEFWLTEHHDYSMNDARLFSIFQEEFERGKGKQKTTVYNIALCGFIKLKLTKKAIRERLALGLTPDKEFAAIYFRSPWEVFNIVVNCKKAKEKTLNKEEKSLFHATSFYRMNHFLIHHYGLSAMKLLKILTANKCNPK